MIINILFPGKDGRVDAAGAGAGRRGSLSAGLPDWAGDSAAPPCPAAPRQPV